MEQMDKVKKNFGFGCMRLPMNGDQVDIAETTRMVDEFLAQGFNYFDTAHGYIGGKSELALKECLTSRYPREAYSLTDKLTDSYFKTETDIRPFFESQLEACGVDYFDFYLMHAQNADNFKKFKACRAYETAFESRGQDPPCGPLFPRPRRGAGPDLDRVPADRGGTDSVQLPGLR